MRASAYWAIERHSDAVKDLDLAIELSRPAERDDLRAKRCVVRLKSGLVNEAVSDVAELSKSSKWQAEQWYNFACVYSLASDKVPDKKQEYGGRAVELLERALKAGSHTLSHIKDDKDLQSIRDRDAFKKLIADYESKAANKNLKLTPSTKDSSPQTNTNTTQGKDNPDQPKVNPPISGEKQ